MIPDKTVEFEARPHDRANPHPCTCQLRGVVVSMRRDCSAGSHSTTFFALIAILILVPPGVSDHHTSNHLYGIGKTFQCCLRSTFAHCLKLRGGASIDGTGNAESGSIFSAAAVPKNGENATDAAAAGGAKTVFELVAAKAQPSEARPRHWPPGVHAGASQLNGNLSSQHRWAGVSSGHEQGPAHLQGASSAHGQQDAPGSGRSESNTNSLPPSFGAQTPSNAASPPSPTTLIATAELQGRVRVRVPDGVVAGQFLQVVVPNRGATQVQVPPAAKPGQELEVRYALPVDGPNAQLRSVFVTVPPGVVPGQQLDVQVGADSMMVQVPPGAVPGQQLTVRYWVPGSQFDQPDVPYRREGGGQGWPFSRGGWGPPSYGRGRPGHAGRGQGDGGRRTYATRGRPPGSTNARAAVHNRPPTTPPHPKQLTRRLVLVNQRKTLAMELAAQYGVALFIVNSASLSLVESIRPARRRGSMVDTLHFMLSHLAAQVPTRAVVLVDVRNETLAARISRSFNHHQGRHVVTPFYRWQEVQRVNMQVNTTKLTRNGNDHAWQYTDFGWGWVDPDTLTRVENIVELVNRTCVCYVPEAPLGHRWVSTMGRFVIVDVESGQYSAYTLFRHAIQEEISHEVVQMRQKAEADVRHKQRLLQELADCCEARDVVGNASLSDEDKVEWCSNLMRRQPRMVQCFLGNGWNAVFRRFDSLPEWSRVGQAIDVLAFELNASHRSAVTEHGDDVGGAGDTDSSGDSERSAVTKRVALAWKALTDEQRQELEDLVSELARGRQEGLYRKMEEERERRRQSYSLDVSSPKRRPVARQIEDYVPTDRALLKTNKKLRRSWRAAVLYAVVMLNATSPESAVTKSDVLEWMRVQRSELTHDAPIYLGIHLSNLCRDGILFSLRGVLGRGKETAYFAKENAASLVCMTEDVWPRLRKGPLLGRAASFAPKQDLRDSPRVVQPGGTHERQARHTQLLQANVMCKARRARFVLDSWDKFAPFLEVRDRPLDGGLARKLQGLEQIALLSGGAIDHPQVPVRGQPDCIQPADSMREYQVEGLKWLVRQHDRSAGGILGDEMGLGKTLQMISFLGFLKTVRGERGPHLVVAPLSVMNAWVAECERWCPALKVVTFHGSVAERERIRHEVLSRLDFDVCVTTYEMLVADLHGLVHRNVWNYVVMDEAHRIKNENSQLGQAVRKLRCNNRMLITGTPLQNNLHELWSLLNLLFPEALGSSTLFDASFRISALYHDTSNTQQVADADLMSSAHALLQPLMLRRLKKDVLSMELPPKIEKKIVVPLSDMQRFLYAGMLQQDMGVLLEKTNNRKFATEYARLNSLLMQLRKLCNHPYMFPAMDPMVTDERIVESSSKLLVLDKILGKLRREGRKALIYSQFTSMLDVIGDFLSYRGYKFLRLDGSTPPARRRYEIACFENPRSEYFLYLISTRAGGLGITLVAADTVILFDSDWNPTADQQAMDRVHRIGQKREVNCYRLVTQGTVEERIVQAAQNKLYMNAIVMRDDVSTNDDDTSTGRQPIAEILRTLKDGLKCVSSQGNSNKSLALLTADEILDAAETKVISSKSQEVDEETAVTAGEVPSVEPNGDDTDRASMNDVESATTAGEGDDDAAGVLGEIFSSLPTIRRFEGKDYSSKKDAFKDLADEWAAQYEGKARESKGRTVQVGNQNVLAWSMQGDDSGTSGSQIAALAKKNKFKHRRRCQRCKRCAGSMLFCARCPVVMHRFCVVAEGYEEDSEEDESGDHDGANNGADDGWTDSLRLQAGEDMLLGKDVECEGVEQMPQVMQDVVAEEETETRAVKELKAAVSSWARAKDEAHPTPGDTVVDAALHAGENQTANQTAGALDKTVGAAEQGVGSEKIPDMEGYLCSQLLNRIMKRKDSVPFTLPVDPVRDECPDYHDVIKKPMDLGTIQRKLREGAYRAVPDFSSDVRLVFSNAMTYNPPTHALYKQARRLRKSFWEMCTELGLQIQRLATVGDWPHDYAVLLKRLIKNKDAKPFAQPVDPERDCCLDYHDVITQPMDLGTVIEQLSAGLYAGPDEMAADVRRTFANAMTYNANKHPVHAAARKLVRNFDEHFGKLQTPLPNAPSVAANDDEDNFVAPNRTQARWMCPHHRCAVSQRPASDCGGMLFRCWDCPGAFSDDCLADGFEPVDASLAFQGLNYVPPTSAEYIRCANCVARYPNASLTPPEEAPIEMDEDANSEPKDETEVAESDRIAVGSTPARKKDAGKKKTQPKGVNPRKVLTSAETDDVPMLDVESASEATADDDWSGTAATSRRTGSADSDMSAPNGARRTRSAAKRGAASKESAKKRRAEQEEQSGSRMSTRTSPRKRTTNRK